MADITLTPDDVIAPNLPAPDRGVADVAISAGDWVYKDPATGGYKLAISTALESAKDPKLAVNSAAAGQEFSFWKGGQLQIATGGTVLTQAEMYYISAVTAGKMALKSDLSTGHVLTKVGWAVDGDNFHASIESTGVLIP